MRMKSDWQTCLYFSKSITVSIEELPKVIIREQSCSSRTTGLAYACGSNEADGKTASAYCTDCGKLMCREHEEVWIVFCKADDQNSCFNAVDAAPVVIVTIQLRVLNSSHNLISRKTPWNHCHKRRISAILINLFKNTAVIVQADLPCYGQY